MDDSFTRVFSDGFSIDQSSEGVRHTDEEQEMVKPPKLDDPNEQQDINYEYFNQEAIAETFLSPGSISASTLNTIAVTMGAGTISMPFIISVTGIALGSLLTIGGAILSYFSSMLLIKCTSISGKYSYEDLVEVAFGERKLWRQITSIFTMVSLLGFTTAYISLAKTLIPSLAAGHVSDPALLPAIF